MLFTITLRMSAVQRSTVPLYLPILVGLLVSASEAAVDVDGNGWIDSESTAQRQAPHGSVSGSGFMLVDRSHGESIDAGLPEAVAAMGWVVVEHFVGPITIDVLAPYDAILIQASVGYGYPGPPGPGILPFSLSEAAAVGSFYASGHGVWIFCDYTQSPVGVNSVSSQFGVTFNLDIIADPDAGYLYYPEITDIVAHPITEGVSSYPYIAGCSLNASPPAVVLATADDNAYSEVYPAGTFPPVLAFVANANGGCGVFQGDNTYVPQPMLANILDCLKFQGSVSLQPITWGEVKARYR